MTRRSDIDRETVQSLLDELYAARVEGELERLSGLFTEDAHFRISGSGDGKPITLAADGANSIRTWLTVLLKSFSISRHEIMATVIEGSRAAVHWQATIHSRITGAAVATELMDQIEVRDGKISSYVEFFVPQ